MNNCNNCKYRFKEKNLTPCRQCEADGDFGWWEHYDTRFVIEELENIKAEIGEAYPYFDSADVHWGFNICRDIIDKHISKLKGETE